MKQIKLMELHLRNFKGIKDFKLIANGDNVRVFGDNATGKTSLFDATMWLLFDKDSNNRKDFQLKTVDADGNERHKLEHEVSAIFHVDDEALSLKKVFKEKWTKKRGSLTSSFEGHTTDFEIDEVPVKAKDFKQKISEIVDEDVFKLVTNQAYFNEALKPTQKRDILMEITGGVSQEEILASDKELQVIADDIQKHGPSDYMAIIKKKQKLINDQIKSLPVRIDEISRSLPDLDGVDREEIELELQAIGQDIETKEEEISRLKSGGEAAEKQKQRVELQTELLELKSQHEQTVQESTKSLRADYYQAQSKRDQLENDFRMKKNQYDSKVQEAESIQTKMERLRKQWAEVNNREFTEEFTPHNKDTCPTCNQSLPAEEVAAAHEKALQAFEQRKAEFNQRKSEELEQISASGKAMKAELEEVQEQIEKLYADLGDLNDTVDKLAHQVDHLQAKLKEAESQSPKVEDTEEYQQLQSQITELENQISELKKSAAAAINKAKQEHQQLKASYRAEEEKLSGFKQQEKSLARIKELEQEEEKLAREYEAWEQKLFLVEKYIRAKVNLLESRINEKFKMARFKLFETQINEGVKEICETLYEGVPYSKGLNNAARINVGLDIISTLSEHYQFAAPIFVDNAEAVTRLIDIDAQVISLIVSEGDSELRLETAKQKEAV
ncbi:hypothetical protein [Alkalicoccus luteus]|uniref:Nuclease SbcCD subunit C n=1 Tax=Alkalicoccus luteus TaxID=1237094 RepID=A0A969TVD7_9BACI|nr:hypothetical protein [Alkalicoccus luteus]NJP37896.1 hypothetical protein [Alkalicoccus luteus]